MRKNEREREREEERERERERQRWGRIAAHLGPLAGELLCDTRGAFH